MHPKVAKVICAQPVGGMVFSGERGGNLTESRILLCLKRDQVKIGMPKGDVHAFRRFFATTMLRSGTDINTVREWGGWRTLETMQRYLADLTPTETTQAMKVAAARLAV